ncbi:hypothetical protein GW17_00004897, partial [Ensete ventricosum]
MALLGRLDQVVASRGLSFTIAPLGAVCAVLFTNPNAPAAQVRTPFALAHSLIVIHLTCSVASVAARGGDFSEKELQVLTKREYALTTLLCSCPQPSIC